MTPDAVSPVAHIIVPLFIRPEKKRTGHRNLKNRNTRRFIYLFFLKMLFMLYLQRLIVIKLGKLFKMLILILGILLSLCEELFGPFGEGAHKRRITNLIGYKGTIIGRRLLGVEGEGLIAPRVITEVIPVTGQNSSLLLGLSNAHTALYTVVDTRSISDDDGRTVIALGLFKGLDALVVIGTHCNLCYVYIAVAHGDGGKVSFFLTVLPAAAN